MSEHAKVTELLTAHKIGVECRDWARVVAVEREIHKLVAPQPERKHPIPEWLKDAPPDTTFRVARPEWDREAMEVLRAKGGCLVYSEGEWIYNPDIHPYTCFHIADDPADAILSGGNEHE